MSTSTDVLNPQLYGALVRVFGHVRIKRPGESMVAQVNRDGPATAPQFHIREWGEAYEVRCPFCDDNSTSLSVNHRYGQVDGLGRRMTYVVKCFAGDCLKPPANRKRFAAMLSVDEDRLEKAPLYAGKDPAHARRAIALPGKLTPLDQLYEGHAACRQMARLGLDADRVGRFYDVGFCERASVEFARNRIIVPIRVRGRLRGWQALHVEDRDPMKFRHVPVPRFFTAPGMAAGELVYNLDMARNYPTGVIVTTPVEVWRFGSMALTPVGEHWTEEHGRAIATVFRRRSLVLLADAATPRQAPAERLIHHLRSAMGAEFRVVTLPVTARRDPLDRATLRRLVAEEAANQGLEVDYKKLD